MTGVDRVVLQELRERPGTTKEIAAMSGTSEGEILVQLRELNDRVRQILRHDVDPVTTSASGTWKADGVAGLLRLNSKIELEVVPKFLDPTISTWRLDFFLLAVLVRTGHVLYHDEISSGAQERGDLATLIARSLLTQCAANERRPIRSYRRMRRSEFAIDGDVDWETVYPPDADGFAVTRLELSRQNPFNATLAAGVQTLIGEVADADTQDQLRLLGRRFGPQSSPPTAYAGLPSRYRGWQQAYELAQLIVDGLGLDLDSGAFNGPGFILSTWSAWEHLCEEVLRRALPDYQVHGQRRWILGHRESGTAAVYIKPDISPMSGGAVSFLLDAKYKTRLDRSLRIGAADLYESLAFLRATKAAKMFLLYPSLDSPEILPLGAWRRFDEIKVGELAVEGIEIQVQGLAQYGGFGALVGGAREALAARAVIQPS